MKILTATQCREADAATINNQHITSFQLMQRAAGACVDWIANRYTVDVSVVVLSGTGNNGGDGLCIARMLHRIGYNVITHIIESSASPSADFLSARKELEETPGAVITAGIPQQEFAQGVIIIDAVFGTGMRGELSGEPLEAVRWMNRCNATVVSIDLPSGMSADPAESNEQDEMVTAGITLTFHSPKLNLLLPQTGVNAGEVVTIDIGLDSGYIAHIPDRYMFVDYAFARYLYRKRPRFSHKGTFGHALLIAGSLGKIGAAELAAQACLRSGAGLLTIHLPACGLLPMQTNAPEAMVSVDTHTGHITAMPAVGGYTAVGIGPGLGTHPDTVNALDELFQTIRNTPGEHPKFIFDADSLNILASQPLLRELLPSHSILTPHPGEFRRLAGDWNNDNELLEKAGAFASQHRCVLVVKGHRTLITNGELFYFNATGNSGMAKGGTGDALTGLITGLTASGYIPIEAALLGVYLHGRAGDIAAVKMSAEGMTAGDLILSLGEAWKL